MTVEPDASIRDILDLADWRRRIAELYAEVRLRSASDAAGAWDLWRAEREALYRGHPSSPVPAAKRDTFRAHHWPYQDGWRFVARLEPLEQVPSATLPGGSAAFGGFGGLSLAIPSSVGSPPPMDRIGQVRVPFAAGERALPVLRLAEYSTGLFLPFGDSTNGDATYAAGRYLLDTAKSADLGGDPGEGTIVLDFNFAYHPSCAFDPKWACPLAPAASRLDIAVEAGERLT